MCKEKSKSSAAAQRFRRWYDSESKAAQLTQRLYRGTYRFAANRHHWFVDLAGDNAVLLAGSGRSGTTWVQELINYQYDHRTIFEPFYPKCFDLPWTDFRLYLPAADPAPEAGPFIARALQGRLRSTWTDRANRPRLYRKRIVKSIRANLFLKWCHHRFPSLKIVLMMRHPFAAIASQMRDTYFRYDKADLMNILSQNEPLCSELSPFSSPVHEARSEFEIHMLIWAIENYVPLQQFRAGEVFLLFYEPLLQDPGREIPRLFEFLDLPMKPEVFDAFHRPSSTARKHSTLTSGKPPLDAWRDYLAPDQIKQGMRILSHCGLDTIYGEASTPCVEAALKMLG